MDNNAKCPFCAERIQADAVICRYCGNQVGIPDKETYARLIELAPNADLIGPNINVDQAAARSNTSDVVPPTPAEQKADQVVGFTPSSFVQLAPDLESVSSEQVEPSVGGGSRRRVYPKLVARDVALNLAISFATGFTVPFVFTLFRVLLQQPLSVEELASVQSWGVVASMFGGTGAYCLAGCWGNQPAAERALRLRYGAFILFAIDAAVAVFRTLNSGSNDALVQPVASSIGSVIGTGVGTIVRYAIGYSLSLWFAKPRNRTLN